MKKLLALAALSVAMISCQETATAKKDEFKTGYIDTSVLLDKYDKFKDENEKFKVKSEEMGRPLQAKGKQLEAEMANFQRAAQANGPAWAQQKYAELKQREQALLAERNEVLGKIDQEGGKLKDTLVSQIRKYITDYGKKEKFDYILTTSDDAPTVIFAKDSYNLTDKLVKLLNEEYKATKEKK
ncbi:OmpH family outer membrane protein [Flavobacterium urocaniciphilum]|uniref:Periplasmic chaperone for outer membrane proteins Skp n=1 Tax=Flavobacterium urocaniciphilum TaxID=1299341 RepID=A0A1H9BTG0_9FLAO|nr:OmpH family outer membrane protein [Flavobacterium urocaniciphilum]SEP92256.1 periplasmic chaperone for outer membrane proteins Skp [Flavobacterium urocaniciphilum]